jgi:NAD(P)-dependent dehydrogenase (short-subunit alcohol dehydrogenase family)
VQAAGRDGVVVGFGSIAECRSRTRNAAYAAAKRALAAYLDSVRHRLAPSGARVQYYVLGYIDTGAAFGHRTLLPKASPRAVAERVFRRVSRDCGRTYYPPYWRPVCLALRLLPFALFRRLSF